MVSLIVSKTNSLFSCGDVPLPSREKAHQQKTDKVFVLDASAVYNGIHIFNVEGLKFVPECVLGEVRGMFRGEAFVEEALLYDELKISMPEEKFLAKVKGAAKETGDVQELSDCDIAVLSLALQLLHQVKKVVIITDDYDIQNLAKHLGIPYRGVHWKGISHKRIYKWVCSGCGFESKVKLKNCPECGTEMTRTFQRQKIRRNG